MSPTVPARFSTGFVLPLGAALGVVLVGAGWLHDHDGRVRENARLTDALAAQESATVRLRDSLRVASARVVHDSVTVTHDVAHYHTLRDTLNVHDTVEVQRFVAVADSTVKACIAFVVSCSVYRQRADSVMAAQDSTIHLLSRAVESAKPSVWRKVLPYAAFVGGVWVGSRVAH